MRGVFFEEEHADLVVATLVREGFAATCKRDRFAGEDDDEDHPWVVVTDAPAMMLELLVEEYEGWLEPDEAPPPAVPLALPDAPLRVKRER